jgi:hypothetical protein
MSTSSERSKPVSIGEGAGRAIPERCGPIIEFVSSVISAPFTMTVPPFNSPFRSKSNATSELLPVPFIGAIDALVIEKYVPTVWELKTPASMIR